MARIMIAEDEVAVRTLLTRALTQDGHDVDSAPDGAAALEKLSGTKPFDLLLTDIQMPTMDGIALALAISRDQPKLKIVLMTGYTDQRERAFGMKSLIQDIVQKPFSLAEIRATLNRALAA
jgi:two-component system cell cycle response regulator CpdR